MCSLQGLIEFIIEEVGGSSQQSACESSKPVDFVLRPDEEVRGLVCCGGHIPSPRAWQLEAVVCGTSDRSHSLPLLDRRRTTTPPSLAETRSGL